MSQHLRAGDSAEALRYRLTSRSDVKAAQPPVETNACSGAGTCKAPARAASLSREPGRGVAP
jgi:hypothetical protein